MNPLQPARELTDSVLAKLKELHPAPGPEPEPDPEFPGDVPSPLPPGTVDGIDGDLIHSLAAALSGSQGPSGLTSVLLRQMCRTDSSSASALREAIAAVARRVATSPLEPDCIPNLISSRLSAFAKDDEGGIRPLGIGEVLRRLICKAILAVTKGDLQDACSPRQLACGLPGGCEAAAHTLQTLWEGDSTQVVILGDAGNAFNRLNRKAAILAARRRCPTMAVAFYNFYGSKGRLLLSNGDCLWSEEGSTQGCPLGGAKFGVGSMPLIEDVDQEDCHQSWYADDSSAAGTVSSTHRWFSELQAKGPQYGYFLKTEKCVAIVKAGHQAEFERTFAAEIEAGLRYVCSDDDWILNAEDGRIAEELAGERHLGAGVGSLEFRDAWTRRKVQRWVKDIEKLAALGQSHPQAAYALLTHNLVPSWRYTMRCTRSSAELYQPLEDALVTTFFPSVFGWPPDPVLRARCALPTRHGGLGIPNPVLLADQEWEASHALTGSLQKAMLERAEHFRVDPRAIQTNRAARLRVRDEELRKTADEMAKDLSGRAARGFEEARLRGGSSWLSFAPLDDLGLSLDRVTFRDAVALRMGVELPDGMPTTCPSCGEQADLDHFLSCKKGGWVVRRHNEVVRAWKRYFEKAGYRIVHMEPVLRALPPGAHPRPGTNTAPDARADLVVRCDDGRTWYFDVAIIDTSCPTYGAKSALKALTDYEGIKDKAYADRVAPLGSFSPLVCSVYGTLGPRAAATAHQAARRVDPERDERDAVMDLHGAMIQAAVIKATSLCLRARSWAVLPPVAAAGSLEDAAGRVIGLRTREA
jgi:hypothetical protein